MKISVSSSDELKRLDSFLSQRLVQFSRTNIQKMISNGSILVNKKNVKKNFRLTYSDQIEVDLSKNIDKKKFSLKKWDYPLEILYQDKDFAIINKPRGVIVHPATGNYDKTLVNILLHKFEKELSNTIDPSRPGIVHRLDKDTSGLMIVAKNDEAHRYLSREISIKNIERKYQAIVLGQPKHKLGLIEKNIGRHPHDRKKMTILKNGGRTAITEYKVLNSYNSFSIIECSLHTGRTHQIRVHLASIGLPIIGDQLYSKGHTISKQMPDTVKLFSRQALHSYSLKLLHPFSKKELVFKADLPDDMKTLKHSIENFI